MPSESNTITKIIEVGHLRHDPKASMKKQQERKVCKFTREIDLKKHRQNVLMRIVTDQELADFIVEHGHEHSLIRVEGHNIVGRIIKDKDGSKIMLMELVAQSVEFLDGTRKSIEKRLVAESLELAGDIFSHAHITE